MNSPDVIVVGGGIVGCAAAHFLSELGAAVTVIEREHVAWGASGRNPGFLWLHTRAEGVQMSLGLAGRKLYDALVEELDDFEFRAGGGMAYFFEEQASFFPAFVTSRRAAGLPMELMGPDEARERCPILPDDIGGATWNPLDAHVHPTKLLRALASAAERRGATFRSGTPALALDVGGERCDGVTTREGMIPAQAVVVAAGVWSNSLLRPLGVELPLVPMRLQMVETAPADVSFAPVLYGPTGIKQYALAKHLPGYANEAFTHPLETVLPGVELLELVAQRRDRRILLGCPMDFAGLDDRPTVGGLGLTLGVIADHLPLVKDLPVERTWAGLLPQTPDALPILGPVDGFQNLVVATGHVFGMLAGPISGKLIAQLVVGERPDLDLTPFRPDREAVVEAFAELRRW